MYKDKIRYLDLSLDEEYKIEKIDEMKSSIFRDIYRKAITVIKSLTESKRSDIAPRGAIITFMGERGCGKTSVLNSFLRSLEMPGELDASLKDTRFITLDLVDASLFEAGEDLFEVILAKMLEKLDVLNKERRQFHGERYDRENLNQKFNDIFETHRMLDGAQKQELLYGHSPLAALRHLYSSEQLKGEFEILVDKYLSEYEQVRDRQSKDSFLVIAIDDLDMNIKYAFSMLEQIYRYLTVRKVIILLAVKYEQLEIICKKNFSMMVPHLAIADNGYSSEYVGATSRSYLDKVLPLQTRIHIPAINDYAEKFYSHIHIKNERALIKEAILGKISRRIGVYFDGCGDKMHFMIPDTLRGLNDYYAFLKTLPKLVKEDDLDKLQYNCSRFLSDFTNRFVFEYLSENDRNEYMKAIRLDARSRNNYLYSIIKKRIDTDSEDLQYYPFGYGNMLRAIYLFSVDNLENKKFGRVIMALYSVLLSRIFSVLQVNTEAEMRKNACGERDVLCKGSWGGVWPNACLPYVKVKGADNDAIGNYSFGYITSIIPDMARLGLHFKPSGPSYVPKGLEQAKKWIVDHRKELRTVEIFFMFFERAYEIVNETVGIQLKFIQDKDGRFGFYESSDTKDFNVLAFIKNSYMYETYFEGLHRQLAACLMGGDQYNESDINELVRFIREDLVKKGRDVKYTSMYHEYYIWAKDKQALAVPIQHVDMYYHILYRLQRRFKAKGVTYVTEEGIFRSIKNIYRDMADELASEDVFYGLKSENGFRNIFLQCPFIHTIMEEETRLVDDYMSLVNSAVVRSILASRTVQYSSFMSDMVADNDDDRINDLEW